MQSARVLGITRNTLRTLLKRYGLIASMPDDEFVASEHAQLNTA